MESATCYWFLKARQTLIIICYVGKYYFEIRHSMRSKFLEAVSYWPEPLQFFAFIRRQQLVEPEEYWNFLLNVSVVVSIMYRTVSLLEKYLIYMCVHTNHIPTKYLSEHHNIFQLQQQHIKERNRLWKLIICITNI